MRFSLHNITPTTGVLLIQFGDDVIERSSKSAAEDDSTRIRHLNGVHQGLLSEVVVDKGGDHAYLAKAKPHPHVLGTVLHEQGHHIAPLHALAQEEVGHSVSVLVELPEGPALVLKYEGQLVGVPVGSLLKQIRYSHVVACMATHGRGNRQNSTDQPVFG